MPSPRPAIRYPLGKLTGFVVSTKMAKTVRISNSSVQSSLAGQSTFKLLPCIAAQVIVQIPYLVWNFKQKLLMKSNSRIWAHDEYELAKDGDVVRLFMPQPGCNASPQGIERSRVIPFHR